MGDRGAYTNHTWYLRVLFSDRDSHLHAHLTRLFSAVYSQDLKWRRGNVIPVQHVSGRGSTRPGYYTGLFFLSIFLLCLECCLYSTN